MITKKIPSSIPYYLVGGLWLIWALLFPMYKLFHFVLLGVLSAAVFFIGRRVFPGETITEEAPVDTGDADLDNIITQVINSVKDMRRLNDSIQDETISRQINDLESTSNKILEIIKAEPRKINQVQTFLNYYLPTAIKLLTSYDELARQKAASKNIKDSMEQIESVMDKIVTAFHKELDQLFLGKAMDISAEIAIMESMIGQDDFPTIK